MKKYLEILKKCPLFYGINEEEIQKMLGCLGARVEFFDKHYTVFSEGSTAKYIGVVLTGSVQVERVDFYGNRSIISIIGKEQVFAEAFACSGMSTVPVDVVATEPSEIMLIEAMHILHTCVNACAHHRQLIFNLMRSLANKEIMLQQRFEVTSRRTTREKLLAYLAAEAKRAGKQSFTIPFDRQGLADYLEVDRSGLSAEISKLRREGVLTSHKSSFTLL